MAYNFTEKQQQLVRDLVRLSEATQHRSFNYTPTFNSRDSIEAHGTSLKGSGSERDLRTLEAEGVVTLRWVRHGAANGTVLQRAFDAVRDNFGLPREAPVVAEATPPTPRATPPTFGAVPAAPASSPAPVRAQPPRPAAAAPDLGIRPTLASLMADVAAALRNVLPADEADAVDADLAAITRQLNARQPEPEVVARRMRGIAAKAALATGSAADLAERGESISEALEKLAALVSLIGRWAGSLPAQ